MPAKQKRLFIPLSAECREAIQALANARGSSQARVASDLLEELTPTILQLAQAFESAKSAPAMAMRDLAKAVEESLAQIDQHKLDLRPQEAPQRKKA